VYLEFLEKLEKQKFQASLQEVMKMRTQVKKKRQIEVNLR